MSRKQYNNVKLPKVPRNNFNLSHERRFTADMFYLYPVLVEDCIPGDIWSISNDIVVRMNPLAAPLMHEINVFVHYYFVPYRLLWSDFEKFITGGSDGNFVASLPVVDDVIVNKQGNITGPVVSDVYGVGGLYDYLGFNPVNSRSEYGKIPSAFPVAAYNFIWHEYYRDQNIIKERPEFSGTSYSKTRWNYIRMDRNNSVDKGFEKRAWEKDYFTSMLPWQQRGVAPALNAILSGGIEFNGSIGYNNNTSGVPGTITLPAEMGAPNASMSANFYYNSEYFATALQKFLNNNTFTNSETVGFDVSDMRLAFQIQKFLERNARTGVRYTEFLKAHFPAYPRDDRLNRPEYIGGSKTPIIISEVLQTSSSDSTTPQGNMAGHGLSADRTRIGKYRVQEFGLIMGIMSIMPKTMYQQGVDRVWLKESKYDFYFPEFANLSEQAVYTEELYNYAPLPVDKVTGYQGRFDEYRYKRNSVHGLFRNDFEMWHLGRKFASAPTLNEDLLYPNNDESLAMKRTLAVPSEPMFLIAFGNRNSAIRPLPYMAEPGLADHG